jgi:hypothetical protein
MADIISALRELRFDTTYHIENRASIADLFRPDKRCGIYVLHFVTGEYYVGQAVDVTRRYVQHCKNHADIRQISFQQVRPTLLNEVERAAIATLERQGFPLRNIALASIPRGESDFDLVMPEEAQAEWLGNPRMVDMGGVRPIDPELRRKYEQRYQRLTGKQHSDEAIAVLREYVRSGMPRIKAGEISFWSCSCLPGSHAPSVTVYSRINVFWQEVFTVFSTGGRLGFSWHLALSPLEDVFGKNLTGLRRRYRDILIDDHQYAPGGQDQINLEINGSHNALKMARDVDIMRAVRTFNLRLMKKGACVYNRYHCLSLADRIID